MSHKVKFGSHYIADIHIQKFKDQLAIAKVFLEVQPTDSYPQLIRELHDRVTEVESMLQEATEDSELPEK